MQLPSNRGVIQCGILRTLGPMPEDIIMDKGLKMLDLNTASRNGFFRAWACWISLLAVAACTDFFLRIAARPPRRIQAIRNKTASTASRRPGPETRLHLRISAV